MQAYEFETSLEHGVIKAPEELNFNETKKVKVIVLLDDLHPSPQNNTIEDLISNPLTVADAKPFPRNTIYER
jgi:hypothetical protein